MPPPRKIPRVVRVHYDPGPEKVTTDAERSLGDVDDLLGVIPCPRAVVGRRRRVGKRPVDRNAVLRRILDDTDGLMLGWGPVSDVETLREHCHEMVSRHASQVGLRSYLLRGDAGDSRDANGGESIPMSSGESEEVVVRQRPMRAAAAASVAQAQESMREKERKARMAGAEEMEEEEEEEEEEEGQEQEEEEALRGRESFDEASSSDEGTSGSDEPPPLTLLQKACSVPDTRIFLPPDPSRQPLQVLMCMKEGEAVHLGGNAWVKVLRGTVEVHGAVVGPSSGWRAVWGGELRGRSYRVECLRHEAIQGVPSRASSPLLTPPPSDEETLWAASRSASCPDTDAAIVVAMANRTPLLEYLHSFHSKPQRAVTGPVLHRLAEGGRDPPLAMPSSLRSIPLPCDPPPRIAVVGGQNTGKSTVCKYLVNRYVSRGVPVAYLDCDVGQCEFNPSGALTLALVSSPLLGPPYTHLEGDQEGIFVLGRVYIGDSSCQQQPIDWCRGVAELCRRYTESAPQSPLIVNTHGWANGLGKRCTAEVMQRMAPTHVLVTGGLARGVEDRDDQDEEEEVQRARLMLSPGSGLGKAYLQYFPSHDTRQGGLDPAPSHHPVQPSFHVIDCVPKDVRGGDKTSAKWLRGCTLTVYMWGAFLNAWAHDTAPRNADLSDLCFTKGHSLIREMICAVRPYQVSLNNIAIACRGVVWGTHLIDSCRPHDAVTRVMHRVVGLYNTPKTTDGVTVADPPSSASCIGMGLVVGADMRTMSLYVTTPLDFATLQQVSLLLGGSLEPPSAWWSSSSPAAGSSIVGRSVLQSRTPADRLRTRKH